MAVGLLLSLLAAAPADARQGATASDTPTGVSQATLDRIRTALANESPLVTTGGLTTFYIRTEAKRPITFADYLKGWVPPAGNTGGGIDLLGLIRSAMRSIQEAQREREAQQIRARIDRELLVLYGSQ